MTKKEQPLILAEDGCLTINKHHTHGSSSESGGGGAFIVSANEDNGNFIVDKTWQEIYDAMSNGQNYLISFDNNGRVGLFSIIGIAAQEITSELSEFMLCANDGFSGILFYTTDPDDYPSTAEPETI